MNIDRALKVRDEAQSRINDVFSSAKHFGPSSAKLNEMVRAVYAKMPNGTPGWVRSYLDGMVRVHTDFLYRDHLVYGGMIDGRFYSTHSNRADYYGKNGIEANEWATSGRVSESGHYWAMNGNLFFGGPTK